MANTILTHQMIAREAAKMLEEESPFLANVNKGRQDEFGDAVSGYKKGDTVKIEIPQAGVVFDGSVFAGGGAATDVRQDSVSLQLDTQKHIGLKFGAKEMLLNIADFKERILRPQMRTLVSVVEADMIRRAVVATPNVVGTPGTAISSMRTFAEARAVLERFLSPSGSRNTLISSEINVSLTDEARKLFNPQAANSKAFIEGSLGRAMGSDFYEHQSVPVITNGAANTVAVSGAAQTGNSLVVTGTSLAFKAGQVFTITGVFAVHPLTGENTGKLMQFTVLKDAVASPLSIYPAIVPAGPGRNVTASPAASAPLVMVGAASTGYRQSLMFHKDAFTVATAPLPVLAGCEGYSARMPNGINVRVMTGGDFINDMESTRIDVLYGFAAVRAMHAVRITE
ncbi:MAG: P22 phage major capsid protein family protein [Burkholderiaceae bacterium]